MCRFFLLFLFPQFFFMSVDLEEAAEYMFVPAREISACSTA